MYALVPNNATMNCLSIIRELAKTYQAFEIFSGIHIKKNGLTPPQFDVIATLGNSPGLSCRELSEKTLMVKGTLTGVLVRLEAKQLINRRIHATDGRCSIITLTQKGQALFEKLFPEHISYLKTAFLELGEPKLIALQEHLKELRLALEKHTAKHK